jgi:type I restriction enzyme S subunit
MTVYELTSPNITWQTNRLKTIAGLRTALVKGGASDENYIGLENIESWTGQLIKTELTREPASDSKETQSVVNTFQCGDILFGKLRPYLAKAHLAQGSGVCSTELLVLEPLRNIDKRFLLYILLSQDFIDRVNATTFGAKMPRTDWASIGNLTVLVPPLAEQRVIAAYLERKTADIDKLLSVLGQLQELLLEKRRALITQTVTRGLNPDAQMYNSGVEWLGDIPQHWLGVPLKRCVITKITDGPHETPEFLTEGIPFVSAEAVYNGRINFESKRGYISPELHEQYSKKILPKRDDIFMVKSGATTGKLAYVDTDINFNVWSPLALIRVDSTKVLSEFLFRSLHADYIQQQIRVTWSAGTQPNISMEAIEELYLCIPPINEQYQIIDFLDSEIRKLETLNLEVEKIMKLLRERRAALVVAAVTGQFNVTGE